MFTRDVDPLQGVGVFMIVVFCILNERSNTVHFFSKFSVILYTALIDNNWISFSSTEEFLCKFIIRRSTRTLTNWIACNSRPSDGLSMSCCLRYDGQSSTHDCLRSNSKLTKLRETSREASRPLRRRRCLTHRFMRNCIFCASNELLVMTIVWLLEFEWFIDSLNLLWQWDRVAACSIRFDWRWSGRECQSI